MKFSWLCYAFLSCLIAATQLAAQTPAASKAPSALEQTAIANEKTLIEAKKKDDGAFFKRTLTPDFSLVGVDGKPSRSIEGLPILSAAEELRMMAAE